jgi:hypothetical protein
VGIWAFPIGLEDGGVELENSILSPRCLEKVKRTPNLGTYYYILGIQMAGNNVYSRKAENRT